MEPLPLDTSEDVAALVALLPRAAEDDDLGRGIADHMGYLAAVHPEWFAPYRDTVRDYGDGWRSLFVRGLPARGLQRHRLELSAAPPTQRGAAAPGPAGLRSAGQGPLEFGPQGRGEQVAGLLGQPGHLVADHADVGVVRGEGGQDRAVPDRHDQGELATHLDDGLWDLVPVEELGRAVGDAHQSGRHRRELVGAVAVQPGGGRDVEAVG